MQVKEYMTKGAITAHERDGLHQTYARMRERSVRHMPVIDEHERLIGVISDRDIRRPDWVDPTENMSRPFVLDNNTKVSDAMTRSVLTVQEDDPMVKAVEAFVEHHVGALMVTDAAGELVGVLSVVDAMRAFHGILAK